MRSAAVRRSASVVVVTATVVSLLLPTAAGAPDPVGSSAARGPLNVKVKLDRKRVAKARIGRAGGTLRLTTRNGTRFTLTVPKDALAAKRRISMTAIASIGRWPFKRPMVGGVKLAPEGLLIPKGVTLTIVPRRAVPIERQAAFMATGSGRDFHLYPPNPRDKRLTLTLTHFSDVGKADVSETEVPQPELHQTVVNDHPKSDWIKLHPPKRDAAMIESELAIMFREQRSKMLKGEPVRNLDDPSLQAELAPQFNELFKIAKSGVCQAAVTGAGWREAGKAALTLDTQTTLLGWNPTEQMLEWSPPKTPDRALAKSLSQSQGGLKKCFGEMLGKAFDKAQQDCAKGSAEAAREIVLIVKQIQLITEAKMGLEELMEITKPCRPTTPPKAFKGTLTYSQRGHSAASWYEPSTDDHGNTVPGIGTKQADWTEEHVAHVTFRLDRVGTNGVAGYAKKISGTIDRTVQGNSVESQGLGTRTCEWSGSTTLVPMLSHGNVGVSWLKYQTLSPHSAKAGDERPDGERGLGAYEFQLQAGPRPGEHPTYMRNCSVRSRPDGQGWRDGDYQDPESFEGVAWSESGTESRAGVLSGSRTETVEDTDCPADDSSNECQTKTTTVTWNLRAAYGT